MAKYWNQWSYLSISAVGKLALYYCYNSFIDPKGSLKTYLGIWHCKGFRQGSFSIKMVFLDSVYEFLVKKKLDCLLKMHFEHASAIG